jgi:hypothetical protein
VVKVLITVRCDDEKIDDIAEKKGGGGRLTKDDDASGDKEEKDGFIQRRRCNGDKEKETLENSERL